MVRAGGKTAGRGSWDRPLGADVRRPAKVGAGEDDRRLAEILHLVVRLARRVHVVVVEGVLLLLGGLLPPRPTS